MKRKELTKTFMMISNMKNPLISMVMQKCFSVLRVDSVFHSFEAGNAKVS